MAFVQKLSPEEEERKNQGIVAPELSGAGGEIAGTSGAPSLPSPQVSGTSGFTDINAYLDANREQAAGMGDVMASRIGQEAGAFRGDVDARVAGFGSDAARARGEETALAGQVIADPVAVANDQALRDRFRRMRAGEFTGPEAAFSPDQLAEFGTRAETLKSRAPNLASKEGAKDYLYASGVNPTLGQVELDSLLLGQDPTARGKIDAAAAQFQVLDDYLNQAQAGSEAQAATFGQQAQQDAKLKTGTKWVRDPGYTGITGRPGFGPGWIEQDVSYPETLVEDLQRQATKATADRDKVRATEKAIKDFWTKYYVPSASQGTTDFNALDKFAQDTREFGGDAADTNTMTLLDMLTATNKPGGLSYDMWYKGYNPGTEGTATPWSTATADQGARIQALQDLMEADYGVVGAPEDLGTFDIGSVSDPLVTPEIREAAYAQPTGGGLGPYFNNMRAYLRSLFPGVTFLSNTQ